MGTVRAASSIALALLCLPGLAAAQDGATGPTFAAPSTCPAEAVLAGEVERILGAPWAELPIAAPITVEIAEGEGGFVLTIRLGEGERTLRDPDCDALVHAAALVIALAIDPDRAVLAVSTPPPPPPPPPRPSPPSPPPPEPSGHALDAPFDPSPPPPPPPPLGLGVGGMLDIGLLPQPSGGPFAEGVLRVAELDARLRAGYLAPTLAQNDSGIGAEVSAVVLGLQGCLSPLLEPRLGICAALEGGVVLGRPVGPISTPRAGEQAGPWLAVGAGLWLPWSPWDALDLELSIEGLLTLLRPRFEVVGVGPIHEPFAVGARFGLAVHLDLRP